MGNDISYITSDKGKYNHEVPSEETYEKTYLPKNLCELKNQDVNNILILSVPDGDWEGLYVNGKLEDQAHSIRICDLAKYCPIGKIEEKCLDKFNPDEDSLPDSLPDNF